MLLNKFNIDINDVINKYLDVETIILLRNSFINNFRILKNHNYTRIIDIYKKNLIDKKDIYKLELKLHILDVLNLENSLDRIYKYRINNINIDSCKLLSNLYYRENSLVSDINLLNKNLLKLINYYKCKILTLKFNYLYLIEKKNPTFKINMDTLVIDYDNKTFVWNIDYIAHIEKYIKIFDNLNTIIIIGIELDIYSLQNETVKLLLGLSNENNIKKKDFNRNIHYLFEKYNINTFNKIKINNKIYNICFKYDERLLNNINIEMCSDYTMLTE